MALGPAASVSTGKLSEMPVLRSYPTPTESETLGMGPAKCALTRPPGDFDACSSLIPMAVKN